MPDVEEIRRLTIEGRTTGLDQVVTSLNSVDQAQAKVTQSADGMSVSQDKVAKTTLAVSKSLDRYAFSNDAVSKLQAKVAAGESLVNRARQQGLPVSDGVQRALDGQRRALADAEAALGRHTGAHNAHGAAMQNNSIATMELIHVTRSLGEQFASGVDPVRALTIESGRLITLFQFAGGPSGVIGLVGSGLARLLSPTVLLTGGLAALGGTAVAAFASWESAQNRVFAALQGRGRGSGFTSATFDAASESAAASSNISLSQSRSNLAGFVQAGIPGAQATQLDALTKQYSRASGLSQGDAASDLAKAFSGDLGKGLDGVNEKIGGVDDRTKHFVETLDAQGNHVGALNAAIAALGANTADAASRMQMFSETFSALKNMIGEGFNTAGSNIAAMLGDESLQHRQDYLKKVVASGFAFDPLAGSRGIYGMDDAKAQLAEVTAKIDAANKTASDKQADFQARQKSLDVGSAIRGLLPSFNQREELQNQYAKLSSQLIDPLVLQHLSMSSGEAQDALDRLHIRLGYFATDLQKTIENSQAQTAATLAQTATQRSVIEYMHSFTETLRSSGDVALASATALAKYNEAIATSNKSATDALRQAKNEGAMIGLTPAEQGRLRAQQEFEGFGRTDVRGAAPKAFVTPANQASLLPTWQQLWPGASPLEPVAGSATAVFSARASGSIAGNNPGNMRPNSWVASLPGYTGSQNLGNAGAFATFDSPAAGYLAANANLDSYARRGIVTPTDILRKWSPFGDGNNNPIKYAATLSAHGFTGNVNTPLGADAASRANFLYAMTEIEHGKRSPFSQASIASMLEGGRGGGPVISAPAISEAALAPVASTSAGNRYSTMLQQQYNSDLSLTTGIIKPQTMNLDAQIANTRKQMELYGKSADVIASATLKQQMLNEAHQQGIDTLSRADPLVQKFYKDIDTLSARAGQDALQKQQNQNVISALQDTRGFLKDSASTVTSDLFNPNRNAVIGSLPIADQAKYYSGQISVTDARVEAAIRDLQATISTKLVDKGIDFALNGLIGTTGAGGLLGGALSSTYTGIASMFKGFGLASGGPISGPGTGTSDSIPAMLSHGEYVINAAAATANRPLLDAINTGKLRRYASGGPVGAPPYQPVMPSSRGGDTHVHMAPIRGGDIVIQGNADKNTVDLIDQKIASANSALAKQFTRDFATIQTRNGLYR